MGGKGRGPGCPAWGWGEGAPFVRGGEYVRPLRRSRPWAPSAGRSLSKETSAQLASQLGKACLASQGRVEMSLGCTQRGGCGDCCLSAVRQAFHLIKAVSVLLNFSPEEESMLKETLEYKVRLQGLRWPQEAGGPWVGFCALGGPGAAVLPRAAARDGWEGPAAVTHPRRRRGQRVPGLSSNRRPILCCASSLPAPDVLVWVKAVSQGQHPAFHLGPQDPVAVSAPPLRFPGRAACLQRALFLPRKGCPQDLGCHSNGILYKDSEKLFTQPDCHRGCPLLEKGWGWGGFLACA